jgi:hypothetical protein
VACSVLFINHPHCTVLYLYDWQGFLTVATRQRPGYHDIRIGTNKPEITEGETTPATQQPRSIASLLIALAGPHASREPDGVQYKNQNQNPTRGVGCGGDDDGDGDDDDDDDRVEVHRVS